MSEISTLQESESFHSTQVRNDKFHLQSIQEILDSAWYYRIWMIYISPIILVLGIFNNITTISIIQKGNVSITKRFKFYYTVIAIFDLLTVITATLIGLYLEDGLALTTGKKFTW